MSYIYIFGTILFTVYGQLILKWRIAIYGNLPDNVLEKIIFLIKLFLDPYILSGFLSAFIAALFWMAAMTKFTLSHAYPFMSLAFVLVLVLSVLLFHEAINWPKIIGVLFIIIGLIVSSKGIR